MLVRSGLVEYRQEGSTKNIGRTSVSLPGTLVALRFDLRASLNIDDILASVPQDDYGFIRFGD
jgi:hypothetical protein